jgi:hypothetical protein
VVGRVRGSLFQLEGVPDESSPTEPNYPREVLYLYLAVTPTAISAALIREDEGIQKPVYFVSKALHGAEGEVSPD